MIVASLALKITGSGEGGVNTFLSKNRRTLALFKDLFRVSSYFSSDFLVTAHPPSPASKAFVAPNKTSRRAGCGWKLDLFMIPTYLYITVFTEFIMDSHTIHSMIMMNIPITFLYIERIIFILIFRR